MNGISKSLITAGWLLPLGLVLGWKFSEPSTGSMTLPPVPVLTSGVAEGPESSDLTNLNAAERQVFRDEVRAYLIERPEVLMEAIAVLEQRQQDAQNQGQINLIAANAGDIFFDGTSWSGGNPDGDITLVEFMDYRCTFCRRAHDEVAELIKSDGNIRIVVKEFPILGTQSMISARIATAALFTETADDYRRLNNALMKYNGNLTDNTIRALLNKLGLDAEVIMARMGGQDVTDHIKAVNDLAQKLQITGTPTFVIESEMVRGYVPLEGMRQLVAELRASAK